MGIEYTGGVLQADNLFLPLKICPDFFLEYNEYL